MGIFYSHADVIHKSQPLYQKLWLRLKDDLKKGKTTNHTFDQEL